MRRDQIWERHNPIGRHHQIVLKVVVVELMDPTKAFSHFAGKVGGHRAVKLRKRC